MTGCDGVSVAPLLVHRRYEWWSAQPTVLWVIYTTSMTEAPLGQTLALDYADYSGAGTDGSRLPVWR